jgi:hypothetical protein
MVFPASLFGRVVVVAFQSAFRVEMYQNNIFFIFLKLFLRSAHQNNTKYTKKIIFNKKNNLNFYRIRFAPRFQTI